MKLLNIFLYYLIITPISLLPFPIIYGFSDILFLLFFYVVGYRKKVVMKNIRKSFPDKTPQQHSEIAKKFYRHFCDLFVESLKIFTISEKQVHKRMVCRNPEVIDKYFEQNRSVIIAGGHYNNWELFAVAIDALIKHQTIAIYKPLTNTFFDAKMRKTRSKYGLKMISSKIVKKIMAEEKNNLTATIFAIDQSPSNPEKAYWTTFLHQDTGVLFGTEKYAKEYNYPVVFGRLLKEKRGYYSLEFADVCDQPQKTSYGEISEKVTRLLETDIIKQPEYWLWTHKRWKHKRPAKVATTVS